MIIKIEIITNGFIVEKETEDEFLYTGTYPVYTKSSRKYFKTLNEMIDYLKEIYKDIFE